MKFNLWLTMFCAHINGSCVFSTHELRAAWKAGVTAKMAAVNNDALWAEYAEVYGEDAAAMIAA